MTTPLSDEVARVAAVGVPAVVHIHVEKRRRTAPALDEVLLAWDLDPPWSDEIVRSAEGSGVIVDRDGRIFTNHHVVEGAVRIDVRLADQRVLNAHVVGSDPRTDVAVLQIDSPGPFPWLPLGSSERVRIGDVVVAIGNPFDFDSSVSLGVISARGRRGLSTGEIEDFLQTDAAINPGSSGGPLVDLGGRVIGIDTAIYAPEAEQSAGISFAIPIDLASRVAADLEDDGRVRRAWIGVVCESVDGLEEDPTLQGAEIVRVVPGGPAERAGLRRGDVIVGAGGDPVPSVGALRGRIGAATVGTTLPLRVYRAGTEVRVTVDVAEAGAAGTALPEVEPAPWWGGMTVVEADDALRARLGTPIGRGVVVARVEPDSDAARMGIVAGDRLVEVGGKPVEGLVSLREQLAGIKTSRITLVVERAGVTHVAILGLPR